MSEWVRKVQEAIEKLRDAEFLLDRAAGTTAHGTENRSDLLRISMDVQDAWSELSTIIENAEASDAD